MDANHSAYFIDENHTILSIPEIRKKMINCEKLLFNKELEYIGDSIGEKLLIGLMGIKKFYRWYFSKNILHYSTNLINTFDVETDITASEIQLIPTNYIKEINPYQAKRKYERYYLYYTDNEDFFWQSPIKQ